MVLKSGSTCKYETLINKSYRTEHCVISVTIQPAEIVLVETGTSRIISLSVSYCLLLFNYFVCLFVCFTASFRFSKISRMGTAELPIVDVIVQGDCRFNG